MHFRVGGEATVLQSLDDMHLPHRAVPVEQCRVPARRQLKQFADAPRARDRRVPNVVLEVDLLVLGPPGGAEKIYRIRRAPPEPGADVGLRPQGVQHIGDELRACILRRSEQLQTPDMHGMFA
jgi:hypothetical protein